MPRHLPPLNALRAFEAAGRHLSLSRAAAELHVTPAAVSHQVKSLEGSLGVTLFRRTRRGLTLSEHGRALLPLLREGFDCLDRAVQQVRDVRDSRPLTVTVAPSFGAQWLVPRLDRLHEAHPDLDVRIDANPWVVDLDRDDIDLAVRYGRGEYPGLHVVRLMDDEVLPVCSPALIARGPALAAPADLAGHVLLHHEVPAHSSGYPDWRMWLLAAGVPEVDHRRGPRFTVASMAVQAAVDGQGVALVGRALIERDVAAGRLVQPFRMGVPLQFAYWLVCTTRNATAPRVKALMDWMLAEAAGVCA